MNRANSPLPLSQDGSGRFLPWLTALMVFLAALSITGASLIGTGLDRWNDTLRGTLTAQLPRSDMGEIPVDRIDLALSLLRRTPGIDSAVRLDAGTTAKLLSPWLGTTIDIATLPLPVLIDIRLKSGADIDRAAVEKQLNGLVPGSLIERRGQWLDLLFRVAGAVELALAGTVLLVGSIAVLSVIFTTQTGLALHAGLIDLLHLMGASDRYIARQFQNHAFALGLRGGVIGLIGAFIVIGALRLSGFSSDAPGGVTQLIGSSFPPMAILCLFFLPPLMGCVGLITARLTVLRSLAKML